MVKVAVQMWMAAVLRMLAPVCCRVLLVHWLGAHILCLLCLPFLLAANAEVQWGVQGSLEILEEPQLLQGGE